MYLCAFGTYNNNSYTGDINDRIFYFKLYLTQTTKC